MQGAQNRWLGQPAGLPDIGRLGEPPLPSATTRLPRNAADGLFTKPSTFIPVKVVIPLKTGTKEGTCACPCFLSWGLINKIDNLST
jgi:hypothetical protein